MPLPTYHIYVQLNAFPSNTSALLTHSPFPCLLLDFPYPSSCPCFPSSQPIPLSHCLDVRQTYQNPLGKWARMHASTGIAAATSSRLVLGGWPPHPYEGTLGSIWRGHVPLKTHGKVRYLMKNNSKRVNFSVSFENWQIIKIIKQIGSSMFLFLNYSMCKWGRSWKQLIFWFFIFIFWFLILLIVSF